MSVVTRFAPSPTGFLHIGGARTALFNWLYARRRQGLYLLRLEDTDRARSTEEAVAAIFEGLAWLGLEGDQPAVFQYARAPRHREAAEEMIERGAAFRCYVTPGELEEQRKQVDAARQELAELKKGAAPTAQIEAAQAALAKLAAAFRSPYRDGLRPPGAGAPYVVRLRAPDEGEIVNDDEVQGRVAVAARDLDDLVLLRSDGAPTYMLAVVVDDHDMGVTHVIRGDDHLSNAARQIPIYQALGWTPPRFAHVPMIHGPDGAKLSKRHGAQAVHEYREMGYLPEALCNYLARLGWSHGDDEFFTMAEAAAWFDLDQIVKSPARLDFTKLASVNAHHLTAAEPERLARLALAERARRGLPALPAAIESRLPETVQILKPRAKTIIDLVDQMEFLTLPRPLNLDAAAQKALKDPAPRLLGRLFQSLAAQPEWTAELLAQELKGFVTREGVPMGVLGPALRAALAGGRPAPDLAQALMLLGREEALARIRDQGREE